MGNQEDPCARCQPALPGKEKVERLLAPRSSMGHSAHHRNAFVCPNSVTASATETFLERGWQGFVVEPLGAPARRHHLLQPLSCGSAPQRCAWRNISRPTGTCLLQHPASQKASPEVRGTNFKYKVKHTFFLGEKLNRKISPVSSFKERVRVCKSRKGNNSQSFC